VAARATAPVSAGGGIQEVHVDRLPAVVGQLLGDGDECGPVPAVAELVPGIAVGSREPLPDRAERPKRVGPPAAPARYKAVAAARAGPDASRVSWRRVAVRHGRAAPGPDPGRAASRAGAAVGVVLAARPVPAEGEAAPGRGGCPGDGVAVVQQVRGNTRTWAGYLLTSSSPWQAGTSLSSCCRTARPARARASSPSRPAPASAASAASRARSQAGIQVFMRGIAGRLAGGAPAPGPFMSLLPGCWSLLMRVPVMAVSSFRGGRGAGPAARPRAGVTRSGRGWPRGRWRRWRRRGRRPG
jgi:hypothetical protein